MQTILVLNSKGGCGKSTLATNLAACYAAGGLHTVLMDFDPQGSSLQWLKQRPRTRPAIHGIDASRTRSGTTRSWQMAVPAGTDRVIIDAPAGVAGTTLQETVRRANVVLIPVAPSPIDIHATSDFVRDLLLVGKIRHFGIHAGVVANRVRRETPHYEPLKRFLGGLKIPFITALTDTENYILASESGIGIHEMEERECALEREQWLPLMKWLTCPEQAPQRQSTRPALNVVHGSHR